jgi:hypothetical protein
MVLKPSSRWQLMLGEGASSRALAEARRELVLKASTGHVGIVSTDNEELHELMRICSHQNPQLLCDEAEKSSNV